MKTIVSTLFLMIPSTALGDVYAQLLRVYDGDTFYVNIIGATPLFGKNIGVRLLGVDTPEFRTKSKCEKEAASEAKKFTASKLTKHLTLTNCVRDKYFRLDCDVKIDKTTLSKMLIEEKFGVPYSGGTKQIVDWCKYRKEIVR